MERKITFHAAFDKRNTDPKKNCGIHGVNMTWILKGELGAIQFAVYTNWHLPHVQREMDARHDDHLLCHPQPADIGYHSPKPMYEGQEPMSGECEYVQGGKCYYDGSSLQAEEYFEALVREGDKKVWEMMEIEYQERFRELK